MTDLILHGAAAQAFRGRSYAGTHRRASTSLLVEMMEIQWHVGYYNFWLLQE